MVILYPARFGAREGHGPQFCVGFQTDEVGSQSPGGRGSGPHRHSLVWTGQAELGERCVVRGKRQAPGTVGRGLGGRGQEPAAGHALRLTENPEWEGFLALIHFLSLIRSKFLVSLCCGLAWFVAFLVVDSLQVFVDRSYLLPS